MSTNHYTTSTYGAVNYQGLQYFLTEAAELSGRRFDDGWDDDAPDGAEYIAEYCANAVGPDGEDVTIYWQFLAVKGEEDQGYEWDDESITQVIPQ